MIPIPQELSRNRVLDSRQAAEMCGFSLPHFRRLYRNGRVPKPIQLGERKLGWQAGTLIDFLDEKRAS